MDIRKSTLYGVEDTITPTLAMMKATMITNMEFNDARECVHVMYERRGYIPACEFIDMLSGYDLINLDDRTNLKEFLNTFEAIATRAKREKKLAQKIRKNLKK
jgi:hypothetical protein